MNLPMPVICECGFNTMDAQKAVEHAREHEENQTLTAENVQVNLKTLYIALHGHGLSRDIAQQRIVWAVQEGLDPEGKAKLEEEEER
jgi:4-hydroxyphenylpyruvate dioxygenase-like putative hemolysin